MTYINDRGTALSRYRRRRPRRAAMGGLFEFIDEFIGGAVGVDVAAQRESGCNVDADASITGMDAQIANTEATWNPTGFYTPDQVRTVVLQVNQYGTVAVNQMVAAISGIDSFNDKTASKKAVDESKAAFFEAINKGQLFLAAANKAEDENKAVDAPGLKVWVIAAMKASRNFSRAAAFVACNVSNVERFVRAVNSALDTLISVIKTIAGIVLQAGQKAISVAGDFLGLLLGMMKFAPYVLVGGGALYLAKKYRDR